MTVQELIDELNKIEDKSLPIYYRTILGDYGDIGEVEERKDSDVLLFEKDLSMN